MRKLFPVFIIATLALVAVPQAKAATASLDSLIIQVQSMMEEMAKLQVQLQELKKAGTPTTPAPATSGQVLGASSFKFTQDLSAGATNDDISKIQKLLKQDPLIYPEGTVSGFFGPKTVEALRKLQTRFGLDPVGVVGPATQALLQRLISQQNADGTYPKDILDPTRPTTGSVLGDNTTKPVVTPAPVTTPAPTPKPTKKTIEAITYEYDGGDVEFTVEYSDGSEEDFDTEADNKNGIAAAIAEELDIDEDEVEDVLEEDDSKSDDDEDEIDEITVKIRSTDAVVTVYYTDDTKERFTLEETDEDELIEAIAEEIGLDEEDVEDVAEFENDFDVSEIEEIEVTVYEDSADVEVKMEDNDDDREFEIDADEDEDEMIEEIADELEVDADDIEDLVDFNYED